MSTKQRITSAIVACILVGTSCKYNSGTEAWIDQLVPIKVENGKVITIELQNVSRDHSVGIRCSPQMWNALIKDPQNITVRLNSPDEHKGKIAEFEPARLGTECDSVPGARYLFTITGTGRAVVEVVFKNMPEQVWPVEIILCKSYSHDL